MTTRKIKGKRAPRRDFPGWDNRKGYFTVMSAIIIWLTILTLPYLTIAYSFPVAGALILAFGIWFLKDYYEDEKKRKAREWRHRNNICP